MIFRFTTGPSGGGVLDAALEATFSDGKKIQSMFMIVHNGPVSNRVLVYREGISGKWLSSEGISFNGLPRTPENLVRSVGHAEPTEEIYIIPAI